MVKKYGVLKPTSEDVEPQTLPQGGAAEASGVRYKARPSATVFLYRQPLQQFLDDVAHERLCPLLLERFTALESRPPSKGELDAWKGSLPKLAEVLRDKRFHAAHIFVELRMPLGGRRCDAMLSGRDAAGAPSAVVVELKAWEAAGKSAVPEDVAIGTSSRQHPSAQVRDYVQFLKHHHSAFVQEGVKLAGCSFLHDMQHESSIKLLRDETLYGSLCADYPLFMASQRADQTQSTMFL